MLKSTIQKDVCNDYPNVRLVDVLRRKMATPVNGVSVPSSTVKTFLQDCSVSLVFSPLRFDLDFDLTSSSFCLSS